MLSDTRATSLRPLRKPSRHPFFRPRPACHGGAFGEWLAAQLATFSCMLDMHWQFRTVQKYHLSPDRRLRAYILYRNRGWDPRDLKLYPPLCAYLSGHLCMPTVPSVVWAHACTTFAHAYFVLRNGQSSSRRGQNPQCPFVLIVP